MSLVVAGRVGPPMGGPATNNDDGWTAVGKFNRHIDPSKMKITKVSAQRVCVNRCLLKRPCRAVC